MDNLLSPDNLVVFTTAPTGHGHIRAMDALKDGLPPNVKTYNLGIKNVRANKIHALGSRLHILQKITEFYQTNSTAERVATAFYKFSLKYNLDFVITGLKKIINETPSGKNLVIISTHFGLGFSIASKKTLIEKALNKKIFLFIVMTDDSPQRVWAVEQSDIIFVPSKQTAEVISTYLGAKSPQTKVVTISYPVPPRLAQKLSDDEFQKVANQIDPGGNIPTQIEIPLSGAAVQLDYFEKLIKDLSSPKFQFTVIGEAGMYTFMFFNRLKKKPRVQLSIGNTALQTVKLYESLFYQSARPAIEITKPSEQAFKAILKPNERGGVILLLTDPIGRQEKDNLNFLIRNDLMPDKQAQEKLVALDDLDYLRYRASHWRAIKLPSNPSQAAALIKNMRSSGIFSAMLSYVSHTKPELTSEGVGQIWGEIDKYLENR